MANTPETHQPTSSDADDAFLDANARFQQWINEFNSAYYAPQVETAAKLVWGRQPENVKEQMRQIQPDAAKKMDDLLSGKVG